MAPDWPLFEAENQLVVCCLSVEARLISIANDFLTHNGNEGAAGVQTERQVLHGHFTSMSTSHLVQ